MFVFSVDLAGYVMEVKLRRLRLEAGSSVMRLCNGQARNNRNLNECWGIQKGRDEF